MDSTTRDDAPRHGGTTVSAALTTAALASAGAGLVHAAAAGTHSGDTTQAIVFAVAAAVQLAWAVVAFARPSRPVAAAGVVLGAAMVGAWLVSRTAGLPVVGVAGTPESVGVQDGVAAALATLSLVAAAWHLTGRRVPTVSTRSPAMAAVAAVVLVAAVPGMAAPHSHGPSHEHDHGHGGSEEVALATAEGDHAHGHDDGEGHGHGDDQPDGPITSLDDPRLSPIEREAAEELIAATTEAMAAFPDVESVEAAGYVSIGDGITGWEHFVHYGYMAEPETLDPSAIESIVAEVHPDGTKTIASAMYIMGPGTTMDDVPDIAGELTTWHDHQDLCWEGARVVGTIGDDGTCARGTFRPTSPMLHVWLQEHPCGPFAGIEGSHGSGCGHDH